MLLFSAYFALQTYILHRAYTSMPALEREVVNVTEYQPSPKAFDSSRCRGFSDLSQRDNVSYIEKKMAAGNVPSF